MNKWLFNPFIYIAGARALGIGLAAMLLTAVAGYYSNTHFDGVIDVHTGNTPAPLFVYLLEQLIIWASAVGVFYAASLLFSRSATRFIDIAGTMALARWVALFAAIAGFGIHVPKHMNTVADITNAITGSVIALSVLIIIITIWMVALMYNAFTVSANIKGSKAIVVFTGSLIIAETLSHFITFYLRYL